MLYYRICGPPARTQSYRGAVPILHDAARARLRLAELFGSCLRRTELGRHLPLRAGPRPTVILALRSSKLGIFASRSAFTKRQKHHVTRTHATRPNMGKETTFLRVHAS